jgi:hypothetical protein
MLLGAWQRHRLSRVGNRQLNAALHRIAITQLRVHPPARAYLLRLQATGKSKREALRVLKRRLVRVIFNLLHADLDQGLSDGSCCRFGRLPVSMREVTWSAATPSPTVRPAGHPNSSGAKGGRPPCRYDKLVELPHLAGPGRPPALAPTGNRQTSPGVTGAGGISSTG